MSKKFNLFSGLNYYILIWFLKHRIKQWLQLLLATISITTLANEKLNF